MAWLGFYEGFVADDEDVDFAGHDSEDGFQALQLCGVICCTCFREGLLCIVPFEAEDSFVACVYGFEERLDVGVLGWVLRVYLVHVYEATDPLRVYSVELVVVYPGELLVVVCAQSPWGRWWRSRMHV